MRYSPQAFARLVREHVLRDRDAVERAIALHYLCQSANADPGDACLNARMLREEVVDQPHAIAFGSFLRPEVERPLCDATLSSGAISVTLLATIGEDGTARLGVATSPERLLYAEEKLDRYLQAA